MGANLVRMSLTLSNFKVTWNKFKGLFALKTFIWRKKVIKIIYINSGRGGHQKPSNMDQTVNEQLTIMLHKESAKILKQITFFYC